VGQTIHSDSYRSLIDLVRQLRVDAGVTQAELANKLGRQQTWVSKIEVGERRLDVEEFRQLCIALDVEFLSVVKRWLRSI
jgi:transcriptional regulator with XRE-family HTH domain